MSLKVKVKYVKDRDVKIMQMKLIEWMDYTYIYISYSPFFYYKSICA